MAPAPLRRHAHRLHRWIGLVVGVQVALWMAGGLVMSALPIERVRGEHKIAAAERPAIVPSGVLPLEAAASAAGFDRIASGALGDLAGAPVWRLTDGEGAVVIIDAEGGAVLSPLSRGAALSLAAHDYAGPGAVVAVDLLADPPSEYGRPGPVWRVTYDDADRTALYVTPDTGEVRARRGRTWRVFDVAWRLHVMDWDDGADFNHPLLVTAAGAGTLLALSGLVLTASRLRRDAVRLRVRMRS